MPPNLPDASVDDYMARLAAELKSLPAVTREEHLRELRQHIEQLIAAHSGEPDAVQKALLQMGDAKQVGGRLAGEWLFQNTKNPGFAGVYYSVPRLILALLASCYNSWQWQYVHAHPQAIIDFHLQWIVMEMTAVLVSSIVVGWLAPGSAFRAAFYGWIVLSGIPLLIEAIDSAISFIVFHSLEPGLRPSPFLMAASFAVQCGVTYLVSAYRRGGFYPLRRADFRIPFLWLYRLQTTK